MKKIILISLFFLFLFSLKGFYPQLISGPTGGAPIPPEIENPELLGINKEPYHATLMPYANLQEALLAKRHSFSLRCSLNGLWKFY